MAIDCLPVELHLDILGLLDRKSLESMSLTSKYYKDIAKELLYADIVLVDSEPWKAERLILEFLAQPQLATYVKSITLLPADLDIYRVLWDQSELVDSRIQNQRLIDQAHAPAIKQIIDSNFPLFEPNMRRAWLEDMIGGGPTSMYLAFILALAKNLQSLQCSNFDSDHDNKWIQAVLLNMPYESAHDVRQPRLQSKLEHVSYRGIPQNDYRVPSTHVALPKGIVTFLLEEMDISDLYFDYIVAECYSCNSYLYEEHPHKTLQKLYSMPPEWAPSLKCFSAVRAQVGLHL